MCVLRGVLTLSLTLVTLAVATPAEERPSSPLSLLSEASQRRLEALRRMRPSENVMRRTSGLVQSNGSLSPANGLVNDPTLDTGESSTQNEVSMAVAGDTICVGYNDTADPSGSGLSRSGDLGVTWEDRGSIGDDLHFGDPVIAVHHASGTFYYADLALSVDPERGFVSIISVARSTDDCRSFPEFANASPEAGPPRICAAPEESACDNRSCRRNSDCDSSRNAGDGVCAGRDQEDKPWIAVDNSGGQFDGSVYACWSRFVGGSRRNQGVELIVSSSRDGRTFQEERVSSGDDFPLGCFVTVGPDGDVYVAWADNIEQTPIRFRRSRDGGESWDEIVQLNRRITRFPGVDRIVTCNTGFFCGESVENVRATLNGDVRQAAQVWLGVDTGDGPYRGNLYAVWGHDPLGSPDHGDVFFTRSADGGLTWARETQLGSTSATDQFEPFIAVAVDGAVSVSWYDRRNDPANNFLIDVYAAVSRDGGASFEPDVRLTDVSFPVPPLTGQPNATGNFDPRASGCYMGEYNAAAGDDTSFYYAWGDNRNRRTTALYPGGRADPDVFFTRRPLTPACVGDCDGSGDVTVDEILVMVNIGLEADAVGSCPAGDPDGSGTITVDEILAAVNNALEGCEER